MSFKILDKFYQVKDLLPKLDVSIGADGDNVVAFGRGDDVVDSLLMHKAELIQISGGQAIQKQVMELHWIKDKVLFCIFLDDGPMT